MKKFIVFIFIALVIWLIWPSKKKDEGKKTDYKAAVESNEISIPKKPEPTQEELNSANISYHKNQLELLRSFKNDKFTGDLQKLNLEIDILENFAEITKNAISNSNDSIKDIGQKMKLLLKNLQIKEYPRIRKEYVAISKEKLWINDISVSSSGQNNTTITYTGGIFAANANKQEFIDKLYKALERYRFKKVNFKWYEHDDRYTYYTLNSPADSEL
jgi:hypothetical protein